jgi:hypothetical protein
LHVLSAETNDVGIRDCSSARKKPLEPKYVWSIRVRLEIARSWRDLVIFILAIDSKLALLRHFDHAHERRGLSYVLIFIVGHRTLARG